MIADSIKKLLDRADGLRPETLAPLAQQYGAEVEKVNARLDEALELLSKGLRSEAVQLANSHPSVIECAARLDFPGYADWVEILRFLNVPVPTPLNRVAVEQLQQAMVEEQPLEKLLSEHRRLAIAKAPLSWRLRVLRQLSRKDVANVLWLEDIESWERVRLKEIPGDLSGALQRRDLVACQALAEELTRTKWRVRIPEELRIEVKQAYEGLLFADQQNRASEIAERLNLAFSEMDESAGRIARDDWRKLEQATKGGSLAKEAELAEPALLWLEQLDEQELKQESHRRDERALTAAIMADATLHNLEAAYHDVLRWELGIDATLAQRFEAIHARKRLQAKRRYQLIAGVLAACSVVLVSALGILIWNRNYATQLETAATELAGLLDEKKLSDADAFVERIRNANPRLLRDPKVTSLVSQLESELAVEQQRVSAFAKSLEDLESVEASEVSLTAVREVERLVRTDEERLAASKIRRKLEQYERGIESAQLQAITEGLEEVDKALQSIEAAGMSQASEAQFSAIDSQISDLRSKFRKAGSRGEDLLTLASKKSQSLRSAMRDSKDLEVRYQTALRSIRAAENTQQLGQAIDGLLSSVPNNPLAAELRLVSREKPLWNSLAEWNSLCSSISASMADGFTVQELAKVLADADACDANLGRHPAEASFPQWREELRAIPKRTELLNSLTTDLSDAVMKDMKTVIGRVSPAVSSKDPTSRYYIHKTYFDSNKNILINNKGQVGIDVVGDASGAVETKSLGGSLEIVDEPRGTIAELLRYVSNNKDRVILEWDRELLGQIAIILNRKKLDYLVKEILIERLVQAVREGSPLMDQQLQSVSEILESTQEDRKLWYEGAPLVSELPRGSNGGLVSALSTAFQASSPLVDNLRQLARRQYVMVGVLIRNTSNGIEAVICQPKAEGVLLVAVPQGSQSSSVLLQEVGKLTSGTALLSGGKELLVAGRPLFVVAN